MDGLTLVIATRNAGKIKEIEVLLADLGVRVKGLADFPVMPEVEEDGVTFLDNARKKAEAVAGYTGLPALADDSGLEVAALGGGPGVYSARYAADRTDPLPPTDRDNYLKLLEELTGVPEGQRQARFVCELVLAWPEGRELRARGTWEGSIALEPRGTEGFGYDPVFWLPEYGKTVAEAGLAVKNRHSHRAKALEDLKGQLRERLAAEADPGEKG